MARDFLQKVLVLGTTSPYNSNTNRGFGNSSDSNSKNTIGFLIFCFFCGGGVDVVVGVVIFSKIFNFLICVNDLVENVGGLMRFVFEKSGGKRSRAKRQRKRSSHGSEMRLNHQDLRMQASDS